MTYLLLIRTDRKIYSLITLFFKNMIRAGVFFFLACALVNLILDLTGFFSAKTFQLHVICHYRALSITSIDCGNVVDDTFVYNLKKILGTTSDLFVLSVQNNPLFFFLANSHARGRESENFFDLP